MNANKKFENAQRIKQSLIETWDLCRKHFYPEGRRIRYQPTMQMMDDEQPHILALFAFLWSTAPLTATAATNACIALPQVGII
jgi:hypothetical protein